MDIHQIRKQLPHRYPFLLVDRVLEIEKGKRIKALKNVTINELVMDIELDRVRAGIYKFKGVTRVGDDVVCEAELMCTMRTVS